MPLAAYLVGLLLLREHVWARYGLILIGCWSVRLSSWSSSLSTSSSSSPGGTGSNFWTALFGGDINLSITMTFCRLALIIIITTIMLKTFIIMIMMLMMMALLQHLGELRHDDLLALVLRQVCPSRGCACQASLSPSECSWVSITGQFWCVSVCPCMCIHWDSSDIQVIRIDHLQQV